MGNVRRLAFVTAALAAIASAGCGASASVSGGVIANDGSYRATWERGWTVVDRDEAPYKPTSTSPGVCNKGGTKVGCFEADRAVAADLRGLAAALGQVHVPGPYREATALTLRAISADLKGLTLRMSSLGAGNYTTAQRNTWFQQSKVQLVDAGDLLQRAYAAFPDWAQPAPAPHF